MADRVQHPVEERQQQQAMVVGGFSGRMDSILSCLSSESSTEAQLLSGLVQARALLTAAANMQQVPSGQQDALLSLCIRHLPSSSKLVCQTSLECLGQLPFQPTSVAYAAPALQMALLDLLPMTNRHQSTQVR